MEKFLATKSIVEETVCVAINQIVYVAVSETIKQFSTFLVLVIKISLICVNIQLEIKICQLDNTLSLSLFLFLSWLIRMSSGNALAAWTVACSVFAIAVLSAIIVNYTKSIYL